MTPQSNRHAKGADKNIMSLIKSAGKEHNLKIENKKTEKMLTEKQKKLIQKLAEKTEMLFDYMGDENTEYRGSW